MNRTSQALVFSRVTIGLAALALALVLAPLGGCADDARARDDGGAADAGGQDRGAPDAGVDMGTDLGSDAGAGGDSAADKGGDKAPPPDGGTDVPAAGWKLGASAVFGGTGSAKVTAGGLAISWIGVPVTAFAGWFSGTVDFDPTDLEDEHTAEGESDGFVIPFDPSGVVTGGGGIIGGAGGAHVSAVGVMEDGGVFVGGSFDDAIDFDPSKGTDLRTAVGGHDGFALGWDTMGAERFASVIGGSGDDVAATVATAAGMRAYVAGSFSGEVDFDPGPATLMRSSAGGTDAFVIAIDMITKATTLYTFGGPGDDAVTALTAGLDGSLTIGGAFTGTVDFGLGTGASLPRTATGGRDAFVVRLSPDNKISDALVVGGTGDDTITAGGFTFDGRVALAGRFTGTADLDPGPGTNMVTAEGESDAFLLTIALDGKVDSILRLGGSDVEEITSITGGGAGELLVGGWFRGTMDLDPTSGTDMRTAMGSDGFVLRLGMMGEYRGAATLEGAGDSRVVGVGTSPAALGSITVLGDFTGAIDLDPGAGTAMRTAGGAQDMFLIELAPPP